MKQKILVTGGTGYIGSHTVVELQEAGYEVIILDNLENSYDVVVDNIHSITGIKPIFEKIDLKNKKDTMDVFKRHPGIKSIIHFAAYKAVGESVEKPLEYYENNICSLINLLKGMKDNNIDSLVFSSSCTVYGEPDQLPVTEKAPIKKANSPYGNTKQICEEIIQDFTIPSPDINFISLRYFNPIGAHPSAKIGELPIGIPNNLVPFITQTAIGIREELSVFGDDYNTPDGTAIRDYINVVDLAKAHVVALKRLLEGKNKSGFEVFNLGTGNGNSVFEVIHAFEKATGQKLKYKVVNRREGDVEKVFADTTFANQELEWKAEESLEDTLLTAWNWEKNYRSKK